MADAVSEAAPIDLIARAMVADLHAQPDEVQQAYRYLYARVALDAGLLELIGQEWTITEEAEYVAAMRHCLLGPDP